MTIADDVMAARAADHIARWGGPAKLLRNGTTLRDCTAAFLDYNPRGEGLGLREAARLLIAAPLAIPPDHEVDEVILTEGGRTARYAIVAPVKGPRPGGIAVYFDCDIVYRAAYP